SHSYSDSCSTGLTAEDIVDRLIASEPCRGDENIVPVFITFFRKFMKPGELVKMLIERIHSIFLLWLSHYWGDFHSPQTRKALIAFIEDISQHESMRPICDDLAPLVIREPPLDDPDAQWGLMDSDTDTDDFSDAPSTPKQHEKNKKKDSGYVSGSFKLSNFMDSEQNRSNATIQHCPIDATSISSPSPVGEPCRPEFSGGLINLETYNGISASTSWASFGAQTLISSAASITNQAAYNLKVFLDMTDKNVAEQLTWIESEVFGKIKARHISTTQTYRKYIYIHIYIYVAVVASISHFNFISAWVATSIVAQPKLNKRAAVLEKFMSIAVELRNHNNYNSLMAILAGINNAAVLRLRLTRESISSKKIFKQYQSLEKLMSTDRSFSSYRMALKASETPGIPYLGIHNQDLVSLSEANKDFKADGTIHWEKFRLMGESIMGMMKFQSPSYQKISPDEKILNFIADSVVMTEDEQYKRSILIEPRLKSSSTNKLRDLWSRV
ncbi:ras guanine nucleotide exchange factor domain-containing protein, partial [Phycomyces blakesleeanus]